MKPVAWMYPKIVTFKNTIRTSCPAELQPEIEGAVAWHPEVYGEDYSVTDKSGVIHKSYPLYAESDLQSLQAERDRLREALVQVKQEFEYLSDQRFRFSREDRSRWDALADNTRRALEGNTTTTPERREG